MTDLVNKRNHAQSEGCGSAALSAKAPGPFDGPGSLGRADWSGTLVRIVDDNAETCASLRFFLESLGFQVAVWTDPIQFLREWRADSRPGCILLDVRMPGMSGLELLDALLAGHCRHPILFLTGHGDVEMAVRALKRGAVDFLLKPPEEAKIIEAVEKAVLLGVQYGREDEEARQTIALWQKLTDREKDVMILVAKGLMNKEIAALLGIAEKTVQQHRGAAAKKLDVRNAVEAAEYLAALRSAEARIGEGG